MPDSVQYSLPRYNDNDPASAATFNVPISAAEDALNDISSRLSGVTNRNAIFMETVPLDASVTAGMLVYFDSDTAVFKPAQALLEDSPGENGEFLEAPQAVISGLVIKTDSGSGTLLTGGYYKSQSIADICLGPNASPGVYYLSPSEPGRAVLDPDNGLRQPVLLYYGDGMLNLTMFYLAHDNHYHMSAVLKNAWVSASDFGAATAPSGATFVYDTAADDTLNEMGGLLPNTSAVFYNGLLQKMPEAFEIKDNYLWCKLQAAPSAGSVTLFQHRPFAYGSAILRSIESKSGAITINVVNGHVEVYITPYTSGATSYSRYAISTLDANNVIQHTPVISDIIAGPGITSSVTANGNAIISSTGFLNTPLDARSYNMNGTQMSSDGIYTYIVFPTGRQSSLLMQLPVTDVEQDLNLEAFVFGISESGSGNFNVDMYFVPTPSASSPSVLGRTPSLTTVLSLSNSEAGKAYFNQTTQAMAFSGPGLLIAKVSVASAVPSSDIRFLRLGFYLQAAETQTAYSSDSSTTVDAVTFKTTAGYNVSKYDLVCIKNGQAQLCKASDVSTANLLAGVALSNASQGSEVEYMQIGVIQDPAFSFTPELGIFTGATGRMDQSPNPDDIAYLQRVGLALTVNTVQISIESAILKGEETDI